MLVRVRVYKKRASRSTFQKSIGIEKFKRQAKIHALRCCRELDFSNKSDNYSAKTMKDSARKRKASPPCHYCKLYYESHRIDCEGKDASQIEVAKVYFLGSSLGKEKLPFASCVFRTVCGTHREFDQPLYRTTTYRSAVTRAP